MTGRGLVGDDGDEPTATGRFVRCLDPFPSKDVRLLRRVAAGTPKIVIYTRASCGLCRRALELAGREARGASVSEVDVDTDAALQRRYGVRVPVVVVDGVEVAELEVSSGQIRRAVRAARRHARSRALGRTGQSP